jgi:hypothetical protein
VAAEQARVAAEAQAQAQAQAEAEAAAVAAAQEEAAQAAAQAQKASKVPSSVTEPVTHTEKLLAQAASAYSAYGADGAMDGDRVIVLMTSGGDQRALRMVTDKLAGYKGVAVEQIDGSAPDNKARRDALWMISGKRAVYPQVFYVLGVATPVFVTAGTEQFEDLVESGTYEQAFLDANPEIATLDKLLAPLLGGSAPAPLLSAETSMR